MKHVKQWLKSSHRHVHLLRAAILTIDSKQPLSKLVKDRLIEFLGEKQK